MSLPGNNDNDIDTCTQMSLQPEFAVKPRILNQFCSEQVQSTCFSLVLHMNCNWLVRKAYN